jgi:M6 family metalloprotease-like protein
MAWHGPGRIGEAARIAVVFGVVAMMMVAPASAVPASDDVHSRTQPDGTEFEVVQWGDERYHGLETTNGYTVVQDRSSGWWYYATVTDGELVATDRKVAIDSPGGLEKHLRGSPDLEPESHEYTPPSDGFSIMSAHSGCSGDIPATGDVDIPVLLANFNDTSTNYSASQFDSLFFDDNPSIATGPGSLSDYFEEASHGQFNFGGDVYGWYTGDNSKADYGNGTEGSSGPDAAELVEEAVQKADSDVDFSQYDNDGDDCVAVLVIHQGTGEEESSNRIDIWSHRSSLAAKPNTSPVEADGVTVNSYAIQPETDTAGRQKAIGTVAHETLHLMGVADYYDPNDGNGKSAGIGTWGLMGSGNFLGVSRSGDSPSHPTAYVKNLLGWVDAPRDDGAIQIPADPESGLLPAISGVNRHYRIFTNDETTKAEQGTDDGDEYFLLANRYKVGFDAGLRGEGLLIWHVNESVGGYPNGDETNKLLDLEEADGPADLDGPNVSAGERNRGDSGDPFPGSSSQTTFDDGTNPSANFNNGTASRIDIRNIGTEHGAVFFNDAKDRYGSEVAYAMPVHTSMGPVSVGDRGPVDIRTAYPSGDRVEVLIDTPKPGGIRHNSDQLTNQFDRAAINLSSGPYKVTYDADSPTDFRSSNNYPEYPLPSEADVGFGSDLEAGNGVDVHLEVETGGEPYEYDPFDAPTVDQFEVVVGFDTIDSSNITLTEVSQDEYHLAFRPPNRSVEGYVDLRVEFNDEKLGVSHRAETDEQIRYIAPNAVIDSPASRDPNEGEPYTLDGTHSSDRDGTIRSYEWDTDDDGNFDDATGPSPTHTWAEGGDKNVSLRVTDDNGLTHTDTDVIHVNFLPIPAFDHTPEEPNEGQSTEFNASASFDKDGTIDTYEWDWDDDGVFEDSTASPTINHTYPEGGDKTVRLRVTDDDDAQNTTSKTFHVNYFPRPSFEKVTEPAVRNEPVAFDASASFDPDGTVDLYEWDWESDGSYDDATTSPTKNHTYTTGGDKTAKLRVTDDDGASNTTQRSFHVRIRVDVDVKPGGDPNSINNKKSTLVPVMIENTSAFDPSRVDVGTLRFGDPDDVTVDNAAGATPIHAGGHYDDADGDGDLDLVVHFDSTAADFESDDDEGKLVGLTHDKVKLFGRDDIRLVGGGSPR